MPKLTNARLDVRKRKLLEKMKDNFEIKDWKIKLSDYIPDFKKIWDEKSTIQQKINFVKKAKLDHIIKINPDTQVFPAWSAFETNHQQLLRDAIRSIIER